MIRWLHRKIGEIRIQEKLPICLFRTDIAFALVDEATSAESGQTGSF
jgi:hypothetical protein